MLLEGETYFKGSKILLLEGVAYFKGSKILYVVWCKI